MCQNLQGRSTPWILSMSCESGIPVALGNWANVCKSSPRSEPGCENWGWGSGLEAPEPDGSRVQIPGFLLPAHG